MSKITAKILRSNPEKKDTPYYESYTLPTEEPLTVLVILQTIQKEIDPSLAYRNSICNRGVCGSCFLRVNGKTIRGCKTLINPGEEVTVEPVPNHPVVRDLVVNFDL
jgi:succinate dehydrogenase / fumarate reductase iron-sulfur subunit